MALRFIDSFDHYATADTSEKWTTLSGPSIVTGGRTNNALRLASSSHATKTLDNQATWIVGFAIKFAQVASTTILSALIDATSLQCEVRRVASEIQVTRNGTQLGITSGLGLSAVVWYYLEYKVTINNSGTYEVRINGVNVLSGSGDTQYTANAYANQVRLGLNLAVDLYDDFYCCDGTGTTNNDFLGDCKVTTQFPIAPNTTSSDWTLSTGTDDYAVVDELTPNDDTDYMYSSTANQINTVNLQDLTLTGSIFGTQRVLSARKDDAGSRTIASVMIVDTTTDVGSDISLGDSYLYYLKIDETNPNTGLPWEVAEVNTVELGVKLVS